MTSGTPQGWLNVWMCGGIIFWDTKTEDTGNELCGGIMFWGAWKTTDFVRKGWLKKAGNSRNSYWTCDLHIRALLPRTLSNLQADMVHIHFLSGILTGWKIRPDSFIVVFDSPSGELNTWHWVVERGGVKVADGPVYDNYIQPQHGILNSSS